MNNASKMVITLLVVAACLQPGLIQANPRVRFVQLIGSATDKTILPTALGAAVGFFGGAESTFGLVDRKKPITRATVFVVGGGAGAVTGAGLGAVCTEAFIKIFPKYAKHVALSTTALWLTGAIIAENMLNGIGEKK